MICFSFLKTLRNGHHFEFLINTKHANFFKDQDAFQKCLLSNGVVVSDKNIKGPMWPWSYGSWIYNYVCNQCLSPLMLWVRISIRARCATLCDIVCQWFATDRWFSPGTTVSSTSKIDRHNVTEILMKVALNTMTVTLALLELYRIT
jgi:hypothetical protein